MKAFRLFKPVSVHVLFVRSVAFLGFLCVFIPLHAQILDVTITNIRHSEGRLHLAIFDNDCDYNKENPVLTKHIDKDTLLCDTAQIEIPITPGTYALSVLDDEDGDGKLRFSFWGIPREGFGFSNYIHKGSRKPHFNDFSFSVHENERVAILVQMKYF